jgi:hypothetical protein
VWHIIVLKVAAILLSGVLFLGYGWWSQEHLSFLEEIYLLSPACGLLIIGFMPFRFLNLKNIRLIPTFVFVIGITQSIYGLVNAVRSSIEPHTGAAVINILILAILAVGIFVAWEEEMKSSINK